MLESGGLSVGPYPLDRDRFPVAAVLRGGVRMVREKTANSIPDCARYWRFALELYPGHSENYAESRRRVPCGVASFALQRGVGNVLARVFLQPGERFVSRVRAGDVHRGGREFRCRVVFPRAGLAHGPCPGSDRG